MKQVIIIVLSLVAIVATIPLWGSCSLNADLCNSWCNIKHFNSDAKTFGCRARCSVENATCQSKDAAGGFNEFMKGLQNK